MDALPLLSASAADARALRRATARGELVRVRRGRFAAVADWSDAGERERHRARVLAAVPALHERMIVSHASAIAMHGLPWIGRFGDRVVVTDVERARGQTRPGLQKVAGAGRRVRFQEVHGIAVTDLVTTAVDIALTSGPLRAITVLDAVRRLGVTRAALLGELDARPNPRAAVRARDLIDFADPASQSAGESISRLGMREVGTPVPMLQRRFVDRSGLIGEVDFWFPEQRVVVEFDGRVKYADPRYRNGRTPEQVVVDEKRREDRLRRHVEIDTVARIEWRDSMPGGAMPFVLREAGIPLGRRWRERWAAWERRTL